MNLTPILLDNRGAIVAGAIADLIAATKAHDRVDPKAPEVVRIIAQSLTWPDQKERPNRAGLVLRWRCLTEEGRELVASTTHPLSDAAAVLFLGHGLPGDTLVTLRHEGRGYDSFRPMRLDIAAAHGIKRMEDRARLQQLRQGKGEDAPARNGPATKGQRRSSADANAKTATA